jgi:hypothetical protein
LGITESNLNSSYRPKHNLGTSQTAQQGVSVWNSRVPITVVQNGTEWHQKKRAAGFFNRSRSPILEKKTQRLTGAAVG